jgi:YidC/Oxa1 family membrane protein insertase
MISSVFNTIFYEPLYNALIILMGLIPWADMGVVIIIFTFLVKLVLFPLSQKSVRTQAKMKELEPRINKIKEQFKDKQEQAAKTMELYKEEKLNPFSGILLIFLQLPIIFALYFLFLRGGLPEINTEILYSFVSSVKNINMNFLGLVNVGEKSLILAILAGLTQFVQAKFASPKTKPKKANATLGEDFARSMSLQMKYVFPFIVFLIAYNISAAIAIYWTTSNLFMIGQELWVKRSLKKENGAEQKT